MWLVLGFADGGYVPELWLPPGLLLAFAALTLSLLGAVRKQPRGAPLLVLSLLLLYVVWMGLSGTWALSVQRAWLETARGLLYVLAFYLALLALGPRSSRRGLRYLLVGTGLLIVLLPALALVRTPELAVLFSGNQLYYPVSYTNGAAAFYLILFWPLLWLAADLGEHRLLRAGALAAASALPSLAFLTQSRGSVWALALTTLFVFALSPARLRTLTYLAVPALLTAWAVPALNRYWVLGPEELSGDLAAGRLLVLAAAGAVAGLVFGWGERYVRLTPRGRLAAGALVLLLAAGLLGIAGSRVAREVGGVRDWASASWSRFTAERVVDEEDDFGRGASRLTELSSNGRWDLWRVAWEDFRESPVRGVGAGSYIFTHERERSERGTKVQEPHSLYMGALAETGLVGTVLLWAALLLGFAGLLGARFRLRGSESGRRTGAWLVALAAALTYWTLHAGVDWLWHLPGVTLPVLLLLAAGLTEAAGAREGASAAQARALLEGRASLEGSEDRAREARQQNGGLAVLFRAGVAAVALVALLATGLPYLSLRYQHVALAAIAAGDIDEGLRAAATASRLQPYDAEPLLLRAQAYRELAAETGAPERTRVALALSLAAEEEALSREPAAWQGHYRAARAAIDLVRAAPADDQRAPDPTPSGSRTLLRGAPAGAWPAEVERAQRHFAQPEEETLALARDYLDQARKRNPLHPETAQLEGDLRNND